MATDDFNRADGSLGANWTTFIGSGLAISGNGVVPVGGAYTGMYWSAVAFSDDQYSKITRVSTGSYSAPAVRCSAGGNGYGWFSHGVLQKAIAGTVTTVSAVTTFANGDTAELRAIGTDLECWKNGSLVDTVSDANISSGSAGIMLFDNIDGVKVDDWEGDSIAGAGLIPVIVHHLKQQGIL